ncbi:MAG TPA: alpha-N-acetylglucosaminidase C-terminal domain-containing protein, partial [Pyrinomonadaceae bacterium]
EIMLQASATCHESDGYCFDVVNLTRQVLCNYGLDVYRSMVAAYTHKDVAAFKRDASRFLEVGKDLDELLGTRHEFLLGPWLANARKWGGSPTEADYYETNAREIITCWHRSSNGLRDYASRQWNGLLLTYYLERWKKFIEMVVKSLEADLPFDDQAFASWCNNAAARWLEERDEVYLVKPQGEAVATSERFFSKYSKELG